MSLNCFFGAALTPAGSATPPVPPHSVIVVSQICVAAQSTFRGRISVVVAGPKNVPLTLGTLHPEKGIFTISVQLLFSSPPTFSLVVNRKDLLDEKNHRGASQNAASNVLEAGCLVHLTGYYEREADNFDDEEADADEEDDDDDES